MRVLISIELRGLMKVKLSPSLSSQRVRHLAVGDPNVKIAVNTGED
jgi:hypothetical protein